MNDFFVLPNGDEPDLCPHYESPEEDPENPCVKDAIEFGPRKECWESWDGPAKVFICPFMD